MLRELSLYVTAGLEGTPTETQQKGKEGRKKDLNADFKETKRRRNKGLLFCDHHRQEKITKVCFTQHQPN